jgi:hypothetical protein
MALSFAIVNWGLQYKMSLYKGGVSATQSTAKLWTSKSSPTIPTQIQPPVLPFVLLVFLLNASHVITPWAHSRFEIPWKTNLRITLRAFFFRPPPALA